MKNTQGPRDQTSDSVSQKCRWWLCQRSAEWKSLRITVKLYLLLLPWSSKSSRNHSQRNRDREKQISSSPSNSSNSSITVEIPLLLRLTTLPKLCIAMFSQRALWNYWRDPKDCPVCGLQCWWPPPSWHHRWHQQWYSKISG